MPRTTTSSMLFRYVYVLESIRDGKRYIGYTANIKRRMEEHKSGETLSLKPRLPVRLIYFEACLDEKDARRREHYLKTTQGMRFLGLRLQEYKRRQNIAASRSGS